MKLNIEKRELSALTTMVYRAASTKNTIPYLSGLLLQLSHDKGLTMTATDMEIGIRASTTNVDVIEEGTVLVNANYLADFIKLLPDTLISMELNTSNSKLNINYGRSSGNINIYRELEYPELPIQKMDFRFSIPQNILKEALRKTVFAAAANHFRQVFTGVLFDILEDGLLKIVASDTHRLAYYTYQMDSKPAPFKFVIPVRTVHELLRFLDDSDNLINIAISDNNVIFYQDEFLLLSRLIEGQYPNYETVIPANFISNLSINAHTLANSLERAKIMPTDDRFKIQPVQLAMQENELLINSYSEAMGEIVEIIEDISIEGEKELKIVFNTNYFLEAVKVFDQECENIIIDFSGSFAPAVLKNPEKDNYLYILVPMRTNN
ncbi:DNA polymerase III, beta chain [Syntrophomonas zehnderi OL-4]|uniref:Beta sliding clamp n=1 Tax=Syntrophomonas zehnderi OL-4 TaxID=690567 RepID=A0A0E4C832_9FIRM|nr:DNA polymerase III subunit beta [Syntrophomonas zehnderi]CFX24938.1 DNA polymerase III, beta chain [Syntrophomonas zehnderi OL-4]